LRKRQYNRTIHWARGCVFQHLLRSCVPIGQKLSKEWHILIVRIGLGTRIMTIENIVSIQVSKRIILKFILTWDYNITCKYSAPHAFSGFTTPCILPSVATTEVKTKHSRRRCETRNGVWISWGIKILDLIMTGWFTKFSGPNAKKRS
jgi:hypothetical protein